MKYEWNSMTVTKTENSTSTVDLEKVQYCMSVYILFTNYCECMSIITLLLTLKIVIFFFNVFH